MVKNQLVNLPEKRRKPMKKLFLTGIILTGFAIIGLTGCTANTSTTTSTTTSPVNTTTIINTGPSGNLPQTNPLAESIDYTGLFSNQQAGIWVSGTGTVTVTPDLVNFNIGVHSQQNTVAAAQSEAVAAMTRIMDVLKANNIADKDIRTIQFSISPVYSYDEKIMQSSIIGYSVDNVVNVKIRNLDNVGSIVDEAAEAGGDFTIINSISFAVDNPEQYYDQARNEAMNDAKAKAQQLADLGGITLGQAIYISESSTPIAQNDYSKGVPVSQLSPSTPISSGQTDITINVSINYSIN